MTTQSTQTTPTTSTATMRAVQYDGYGEISDLAVREIERPVPGPGEVLVRVRAAAINPGELAILRGAMRDRWPSTFPSGQGSDLAGTVEAVGDGVTRFTVGDEVFGFVHTRSSQAEYAVAEEDNLAIKPERLSFEVAGAIFVGPLAGVAGVLATEVGEGDVVVVAGAAGGAGSVGSQYARHLGATVIGLASPGNHAWLESRGIVPLDYAGDGLAERILAASPNGRVDALVDVFGGGYVQLAVEELRVAPGRIDTIIDFPAVERFGVHGVGSSQVASPELLAEVAGLIADGTIDLPIAATYPLAEVQAAYTQLAERHTRGKIVLIP